MHILFVHRSFPARFGHLAQRLVDRHGCRVTFVAASGGKSTGGVRRIAYKPMAEGEGEAFPAVAPFVEAHRHAVGVLMALKRASAQDPSILPDLVVGPGGMGSTHLLPELWPDVPIVTLFDWFYTPSNRPEAREDDTLPDRLRARVRSASSLLDLEAMAGGWTPTRHQRQLFGPRHSRRLKVVPEAVDLETWHREEPTDRKVGTLNLEGKKLVTFVARAGEPGRGRAQFMPVAQRLVKERDDVHVLIVAPRAPQPPAPKPGQSAPGAGGGTGLGNGGGTGPGIRNLKSITEQPRIHANAPLPPAKLRRILSLSDLHVHVGAPHALAWSLLDAMACAAPILATSTPPVRETLNDGVNAAITRVETDALVTRALDLLADPAQARSLGDSGRDLVQERHALDVVMPALLDVWAEAMGVDRDTFEGPSA